MNPSHSKPANHRLFYSAASLLLLLLTFVGFRLFYLHMQAFPGRPLAPPIRTVLITHGTLMTVWMLLAAVQPLLVASGWRKLHMKLGMASVALAAGIVVSGYLVAVGSARVNPPDLKIFGLTPMEFLTVPLSGILTFGTFFLIGVWKRKRPDIHRPMMFMASLSVVSAAVGRIPPLNAWYAGTWLEHWLSAFATTLAFGVLLIVAKSVLERRLDRWFAGAFAGLFAICIATSLVAKTESWVAIAKILTHTDPAPKTH